MRNCQKMIVKSIIILFVYILSINIGLFISKNHGENVVQENMKRSHINHLRVKKDVYAEEALNISALCSGDNSFWIVYTKFENNQYFHYLYCLDEYGQKQYVNELPWKEYYSVWNDDREKFYYLLESMICEYDPNTAEVLTYKLPEGYTRIIYSNEDYVYLSDDYGHKAMLSLVNFETTLLSGISGGRIIDVRDGYIISKGSNYVSCCRVGDDTALWTVDAVSVCISNDVVYYSLDDSSGVFVLDFWGEMNAETTSIRTRTHAVVDAGEYVVCAVRGYQSIVFKALYPDGTVEDIAVWEDINYELTGSTLLEVWNGKLFCTITTANGLFTCELL